MQENKSGCFMSHSVVHLNAQNTPVRVKKLKSGASAPVVFDCVHLPYFRFVYAPG